MRRNQNYEHSSAIIHLVIQFVPLYLRKLISKEPVFLRFQNPMGASENASGNGHLATNLLGGLKNLELTSSKFKINTEIRDKNAQPLSHNIVAFEH